MSRRTQTNTRLTTGSGPARATASTTNQVSAMDRQTQLQFMYMFERLSEPLYFGPRGSQNYYFMVEPSSMDENTRKTAQMFRQGLQQAAIVSNESFNMKMPRNMPNLSSIGSACKRGEIFSYFLPSHKQAANELTEILMGQSSREEFLSMCCYCRDSSMVNSQLWVHASVSAALKRRDMRGVVIPALWEVTPDLFINAAIRKLAQQQSSIPMDGRVVLNVNGNNLKPTTAMEGKTASDVVIDSSFSGRSENPENKLWYFREDLGVASHHWHWHVVYSGQSPVGSRDRKGELFYYMHHSMLARYDSDRLCNGLARVRILDIATSPVIEEGYFPKLTSENSGQIWGGRQEATQLRGVSRTDGDREFRVDIEDIRKWKDRILDAIDTGFIIKADGQRESLAGPRGIDILGGLVENGGLSSLNDKFYGNLHNLGHVIIAYAHDPEKRHNENIGPMGDEATAMKDPVFYRWHKFIDDLFDKYKQTQGAYPEQELLWQGVRVSEVSVSTEGQARNVLLTNWMQSDIDLTRGLDLRRSSAMTQGPVWARVTHLNHEPFTYNITVENNAGPGARATVRIFLAPRFNEHGQRFPYSHQRTIFFEMDKFTVQLQKGTNRLTRSSADSSVTIPWESSFRDLEKLMQDGELKSQDAICGCGWPHHLLLPMGNAGGVIFDLFVMLTDGAKDAVPRKNPERPNCKESLSYCGSLDELYPDTKPMGFPFDKIGRSITKSGTSMSTPVQNLDEFIPASSNMATVQVTIIHQDKVSLRGNGAPATTAVITPSRATARDRNQNSKANITSIIPESPPPRGRARSKGRPSGDERDVRSEYYDNSPDRFSD